MFNPGFRTIASGLAAVCLSLSASAQLTVDKLWMDIDSKSSASRHDVVLRNEGTMTYFVTVAPAEVLAAGTPDETRVEIENPEELGLLVSPNRIVLEPGASRALRIVSINPPLDQERVYRVRVTPQVGQIQAETTTDEERGINIVMLTAYDLLVTVRPVDPKLDIRASREGNQLVLTNGGNTNTLLVDGEACLKSECTKLSDARLYAGGVVRFDLPDPVAEVRIKSRDQAGGRERELTF